MSKPAPTLPNGITSVDGKTYVGTVMDTTYTAPTGNEFPCHTTQDFRDALLDAQPGDCIMLDPGVEYVGNFVVPERQQGSTPQWIHITTAGFHGKHPCGTRITPADAADMARLASPNVSQVLSFKSGQPAASYIRIYGVELTSNSTYAPGGYTPGVFYGYALVAIAGAWQEWDYQHVPSNIIFDRCYIHGDSTHDLQCALQANFGPVAVIDSYISEIHMGGADTSAVGCFCSPGPIKIVNNHLEAAGENVIFGGSGGNVNQNPADIEIRENYFFKPLEWVALSTTQPTTMVVKNSFEIKDARRVLFDRNVIENCWKAGQEGHAIVLTVRSGQSGDNARCDDLTITNNILRNVVAAFSGHGADDGCGPEVGYPDCHCAGSQARWVISNNLVIFYDPKAPGGTGNNFLKANMGMDRINGTLGQMHDIVMQHNTCVLSVTEQCSGSVYFSTGGQAPNWSNPPEDYYEPPITSNLWILDNVFMAQLSGQNGHTGTQAIAAYISDPESPDDSSVRFRGNVMWRASDVIRTWPPDNVATDVPPTFVDPANGDYSLAEPVWVQTSDGALAGVDMSYLPGGETPEPPEPEPAPVLVFSIECRVHPDAETPTVEVAVDQQSVHWE